MEEDLRITYSHISEQKILTVEEVTHLQYLFSGLKANFSKCEIAGPGSLKRVLEAVCGFKSINLTLDTIKILGAHFRFSYKGTFKVQSNFLDTVQSIQQGLRFWNNRILSVEGRIIIFKALAHSKIVYLAFLTVTATSLIEELQKLQKKLIWHS